MTYSKKARNEEMETELREDKIRELKNEFDDGDFETWKGENQEDLIYAFIENNEREFNTHCMKFKQDFIDDNENDFNDYCSFAFDELRSKISKLN